MRLDAALVERGLLPSRTRAKGAVIAGLVSVDGEVVTKPSARVDPSTRLEVTPEGILPRGYRKLATIDGALGVVKEEDVVLDLGSSAGGFILYCAPRCAHVYGIEVTDEFRPTLEGVTGRSANVSVTFADAFSVDPVIITNGEPVTLILNDLTVEPIASLGVTARFLPLLVTGGRVLQVLKLGDGNEKELEDLGRTALMDMGVVVEHIMRGEGKELYLLGRLAFDTQGTE
jgi:23S rRNA (cytidine1920-2'-O)/16S rRNA (cytidine1409-2'-O)-methyltransferase